jgi:ketosteroid isomerase-like protein
MPPALVATDSLQDVTNRLFAAGDPEANTKVREQNHVNIVTSQLAALLAGDPDGFVAHLAPDVEVHLHTPPEFAMITHARGPEAAKDLLIHNFGLLADQQAEILSIVAQGDTVVMVAREQGRIRATNQAYQVYFVAQYIFQDGKLTFVRQIGSMG